LSNKKPPTSRIKDLSGAYFFIIAIGPPKSNVFRPIFELIFGMIYPLKKNKQRLPLKCNS